MLFAGSVIYSHELSFRVWVLKEGVCIAVFKSGLFLFLSKTRGTLQVDKALTAVLNHPNPQSTMLPTVPDTPPSDRELTYLLREFRAKLEDEWPTKWTDHGPAFAGVEELPSKNAFYNDLADALNDAYKNRYGIHAAAHREIKVHTVRRIMEEGAARNYDERTRDLLAVYLGYESWIAYRMGRGDAPSPASKSPSGASRWGLLAVAGMLLALGGLYWYGTPRTLLPGERLTLLGDSLVHAPGQVKVHYDLRGLEFGQAYVSHGAQQVVVQRNEGGMTFAVERAQSGPVQLYVDDKLVTQVPVLVVSDGWEGFMNLRVPLEKSTFYRNGLLHLPSGMYPTANGQEYYPAFLNFREYGLSADAMLFEARVLNNAAIGGQWAYDVSVDLVGSRQRAYFNVLAPDAVLYAQAGVAETKRMGSKDQTLKALGFTMNDWCVLSMRIENHTAVIRIDGKEALSIPYRESLGKLRGIQFYMKGSGAVDWVKVTDLEANKVKYFDDFLGEKP